MDIIIVITAIVSVVDLFLLVALLLRKPKAQGGDNDKLSDVRNAALINSIDRNVRTFGIQKSAIMRA